ncbi:MAG: pre-16S rRNA-processing nuclease YqgF [Candidatus Eremiobacteraeota bacterium]|nr:pre-16S rRNA-processing nuclease YqgF [Candidatus Eremiobacteraeota bacterium]
MTLTAARDGSAPILGIDPGTRKCGMAVVVLPGVPPLALEIVPFSEFEQRVSELIASHGVRAVALGGGTHTAAVAASLGTLTVPLAIVDERDTTYLARERYFRAHPPKGWRRFVPRGMLLPPRPIDDFAALLIAERFLEREAVR